MIGFVKFYKKRDQFCVWFSLRQLPTGNAQVFFQSRSLNKKRLFLSFPLFSYLFNASTRLCTLSSPIHVKYYLNSQIFRHFKTQRENFVMMTSFVRPLIRHGREPMKMRD